MADQLQRDAFVAESHHALPSPQHSSSSDRRHEGATSMLSRTSSLTSLPDFNTSEAAGNGYITKMVDDVAAIDEGLDKEVDNSKEMREGSEIDESETDRIDGRSDSQEQAVRAEMENENSNSKAEAERDEEIEAPTDKGCAKSVTAESGASLQREGGSEGIHDSTCTSTPFPSTSDLIDVTVPQKRKAGLNDAEHLSKKPCAIGASRSATDEGQEELTETLEWADFSIFQHEQHHTG